MYEPELDPLGLPKETSKIKEEPKDPRRKIYNHRRHWPRVFEELAKWKINPNPAVTPSNETPKTSVQLGGICSISGLEIDIALFDGDYLTSNQWGVLRIAEPCAVVESSAKQNNDSFKQTEIKQNLLVMLGSRSVVDELIETNSAYEDEQNINDFYNVNIKEIIMQYQTRANEFYKQESEIQKQANASNVNSPNLNRSSGNNSPGKLGKQKSPSDIPDKGVYAIFSRMTKSEIKNKTFSLNHSHPNREWIKYACETTDNANYFRNRTSKQLEELEQMLKVKTNCSTFVEIPATISRYNSLQNQPPGQPSIYTCVPLELQHKFVTNFLQAFGISADVNLYEFFQQLINNYTKVTDAYQVNVRHELIRKYEQELQNHALNYNGMFNQNTSMFPYSGMYPNMSAWPDQTKTHSFQSNLTTPGGSMYGASNHDLARSMHGFDAGFNQQTRPESVISGQFGNQMMPNVGGLQLPGQAPINPMVPHPSAGMSTSNPNSTTEKPVEEADLLKDDCRKFNPIDWLLEPQVRFLYARTKIQPPGIDTILKRVGFKGATDTIPKVIQRKVCDNLDRIFSIVLLKMTLFILSLDQKEIDRLEPLKSKKS